MNNKLIANYDVANIIIRSDIRNPFNIYFHIRHIRIRIINGIEVSKVGIFIKTFLEQDGDACNDVSRCSPILVCLPSWWISLSWTKFAFKGTILPVQRYSLVGLRY